MMKKKKLLNVISLLIIDIWCWYVLFDDQRDEFLEGKYKTCDHTNWFGGFNVGTRFDIKLPKITSFVSWLSKCKSFDFSHVPVKIFSNADYQSSARFKLVLSDNLWLKKKLSNQACVKILVSWNQSLLTSDDKWLMNEHELVKSRSYCQLS